MCANYQKQQHYRKTETLNCLSFFSWRWCCCCCCRRCINSQRQFQLDLFDSSSLLVLFQFVLLKHTGPLRPFGSQDQTEREVCTCWKLKSNVVHPYLSNSKHSCEFKIFVAALEKIQFFIFVARWLRKNVALQRILLQQKIEKLKNIHCVTFVWSLTNSPIAISISGDLLSFSCSLQLLPDEIVDTIAALCLPFN